MKPTWDKHMAWMSKHYLTYVSLPLLVNPFKDSVQLVDLLHGIPGTRVLPDQDKILYHCKKQTKTMAHLQLMSSHADEFQVLSWFYNIEKPDFSNPCRQVQKSLIISSLIPPNLKSVDIHRFFKTCKKQPGQVFKTRLWCLRVQIITDSQKKKFESGL